MSYITILLLTLGCFTTDASDGLRSSRGLDPKLTANMITIEISGDLLAELEARGNTSKKEGDNPQSFEDEFEGRIKEMQDAQKSNKPAAEKLSEDIAKRFYPLERQKRKDIPKHKSGSYEVDKKMVKERYKNYLLHDQK